MSQRHKRNYISVIQCSNVGITTSLDEVRAEFVRYYSELLGTPKATIPIDADVLHCGPCLDDRYHDFHLAPVSSDDIKTAPFGIGNDKAHEPDGYSSLFFKKSWDTVGEDFCAAVRDF
jgi:hypothetical protein